MYIAVAAAIGFAAGLLTGGRLANLAHPSFRAPALLVAGVAVQVASNVVDQRAVALLLASYGLLLAFALANFAHVGMIIVFVGIAMNTAVIAANDGMPVRGEAIVAAGVTDADGLSRLEFDTKHHLETDGDRLTVLADIIPVPFAGAREVVSFGDLVMAVGTADVIAHWLRRHHRLRAAPTGTAPAGAPGP